MKYNKESRIEVANKNSEIRKKRTPIQQIIVLDSKFGKNQGAKRERERLLKIIEEAKNKKEEDLKIKDNKKRKKDKENQM
jgi:hypothetical protein